MAKTRSKSTKTRKGTRPISSHRDGKNLVNKAFTDLVLTGLIQEIQESGQDGSVLPSWVANQNTEFAFIVLPACKFSHIIRQMKTVVFCIISGKTVYTGVTFAGQVGLLTAQRPNAITVSLDERDRCCLWLNIFEAIFNKKAMPITFLIRDVVSSKEIEFDHAVKMLSQVPLMAAGYLIVGGTTVGQGAVITRNRENAADIWYLSKDASKSP